MRIDREVSSEMGSIEEVGGRPEVLQAAEEVAKGNPWYTADQVAGQTYGPYRYNMKLRYEYVERHLKQLGIDGKKVVDLGCGDGQWSIQLKQSHEIELVGVDYNELRLDRYRHNVPDADALFGSCLDIPLEDDFADVVMFHQVLEHIPQPAEALAEVRRILKAGGWLILSVPNEGTWLKQQVQYRFIEPHALEHTDHVNFFTRSTLRQSLERSGFSVKRLDTVGFYFPHNGLSRRLLTNRWSFKVGVAIAQVIPVFRDCLFAWCQPQKPSS